MDILGGNADSRIRNGYFYILTRCKGQAFIGGVYPILGSYRDRPPRWHGMEGIDDNIINDLADLIFVILARP